MAWVTKDSVEQYETPESKKRIYQTGKSGQLVALPQAVRWHCGHRRGAGGVDGARCCYPGAAGLPRWLCGQQQLADRYGNGPENTLAAYCDDRNGDGKVVVELVQYNLDFDSESENTDAYTQMADVTRLSADLSSEDGPYIFIMQDTDYAQQFAETTGDLQYLDGTMPDTENVDENDNVIVDWTKMVYRWTDCPALTGLDLGTYTGLTMVDDLQGENQDIMKNTYIGRRAYYTDKTALESETYDALWNILTAGAVSTVGQQ